MNRGHETRWMLVALCVTAVGCETPVGAARPQAVAPRSVAEPEPEEPPPSAECVADKLTFVGLPAAVALACQDGHRNCRIKVPFAVHNCDRGTVRLETVTVSADGQEGDTIIEPAEHELGPGSDFDWRITLVRPGTYFFRAHYLVGEQAATVDAKVVVDNPALARAKQACDECRGEWGKHGMLGLEGCLCRTKDGGTVCDDGRDCEGECVGHPKDFRCAEFVTTFGCHRFLPDGASEQVHPMPYGKCTD